MTETDDLEDLFIITLAREMLDGDRIFVGTNQSLVALAAYVARRLWAPNLKVWASGSLMLDATRDRRSVGRRGFDSEVMQARGAFFWQARVFDEMGLRSPVCFGGGVEVDAMGNANLEGVRDASGWNFRGPGSAGLPTLTTWTDRFYLIAPVHDSRRLVDRCSRISVLGDPTARQDLGLPPNSMRALITPLARFECGQDGLELTEVSPGVSRERLQDVTGFAVKAYREPRTRPLITADEKGALEWLRQE